MIINPPDLPFDVLNLILKYDGRIKYNHKEGTYVNVISANDYRYNIVKEKIIKKTNLMERLNISNNGLQYYIDVKFKDSEVGLVFSKKML